MSASTKIIQAAAGAGGSPEGAWDLSYAYYNPPVDDRKLSTASIQGSLSTAGSANSPQGIFLKPDGTKAYIADDSSNTITEWNLSTAWDISTATYSQSSAGITGRPRGLFIRDDGLKAYVTDYLGGTVTECTLTTAWDMSTLSVTQFFSTGYANTNGVVFKPDGLTMIIVQSTSDLLVDYTLSTAWDVSTASLTQTKSVAGQETAPQGLGMTVDGTKLYIVGGTGDDFNEYNLSTAWDISTAVFSGTTLAVGDNSPTGCYVSPNGEYLFGTRNTADLIVRWVLGGFSTNPPESSADGIYFRDDGLKMYFGGTGVDDIQECDLTTEWDTSTASITQAFSFTSNGTRSFSIKSDGTELYLVNATNDTIEQYSFGTAWDVSTLTLTTTFSVSSQSTSPDSVIISSDGNHLYVNDTSDDYYQYDLSTPFDLSTATYSGNTFNPSGTNPRGFYLRDTGTTLFICDVSALTVSEYSLLTAWDISTASLVQSISVFAAPQNLFFKPDGTQMFILDNSADRIFTYSLGVQE